MSEMDPDDYRDMQREWAEERTWRDRVSYDPRYDDPDYPSLDERSE
ncbi:MAG TPA: hypothetical protein VJL80_06270 [Aeromicrobium sp.]|nr:hypothetical protein [Aeromicrobium sp.]HKY57624.1 hypothetical protein [Aeromicrobium sp.]